MAWRLVLGLNAAVICSASATTNAVEQFKAFLEHPTPLDLISEHSGDKSCIHEIWQPNAFVHQRFPTASDFSAFEAGSKDYFCDAAGYYDNVYWRVTRAAYEWWKDDATPPACPILTAPDQGLWWTNRLSPPSAARASLSTRDITFSRILCGGLWEIPVGSIRWTGDSFCLTNRRGFRLSGSLWASNGFAARLDATRAMTTSTDYYTFLYSGYPTNSSTEFGDAPFFPRKITSYYHATPAEQFSNVDFEFQIHSLHLSRESFPKRLFEAPRYWHQELEYETRTDLYAATLYHGRFIILHRPFFSYLIATRGRRMALIYFGLGIVVIAALFTIFEKRRK